MRTRLLVLLSFVALVGAFLVYARIETRRAHGGAGALLAPPVDPPPPPPKGDGPGGWIRPGSGAWLISYDESTGAMKNRFRADEYTPRDDGTVVVMNPVAEFFMQKGQMMRLTGKTGEVVVPSAGGGGKGGMTPHAGTPNRGRIHDCVIELFDLFPDSPNGAADETIWVDNIQFDNETMLITTEGFNRGDEVVQADQVPVKMRGKKYDFDGRGLRLRWNDKDGRLELLEVAHGEQLLVRDSSGLSGTLGGGLGKVKGSAPPPPALQTRAGPLPAMLASADPAAAGEALAQPPPAAPHSSKSPSPKAGRRNAPPQPYLATFYENVRITQGAAVLVTADQMAVSFTTRNDTAPKPGPSTSSATRPAPPRPQTSAAAVPSSPRTAPADDASAPGQSSASAGPAHVSPATAAVVVPSTQPAPPVIVRWTGKLIMHPAPAAALNGDADGAAVIDLTGAPVVIRRTPVGQGDGDDIRAARVIYHTADGSATLLSSPEFPQVSLGKLVNGKPDAQSSILTQQLSLATDAEGNRFALLNGPGHADVPMTPSAQASADTPGGHPNHGQERMDARWSTGAKVYFAGKGQEEMTARRIDLAGDVDIRHPQLLMQSQSLSLIFSPAPPRPATQPAAGSRGKSTAELQQVSAADGVHCVILGQGGKKQTIDARTLDLATARTPEGKFYARAIVARGSVHAFDVEQDLRAQSVDLTLRPAAPGAPATRPATQTASDTAAVELEKLVARDDVQVVNKEGSRASGAELVITSEGGPQRVRLSGTPLANVVDARGNVISGPLITVEPKLGVARIIGAGNMHLLQEQPANAAAKDPAPSARPIDVAWSDRADLDGPGNRVDILGDAIIKTFDAEGTSNTATGDRVRIDLVKKATPATQSATRPATQPAGAMRMDALKDKDVAAFTLIGNAKIKSISAAPDGAVTRQFVLVAPTLIYQLVASEQLAAKTLWAPSAGQMFMGDHQPPATAGPHHRGQAPQKQRDDEASSRGDTAFQWSRQLIYSETTRRAIMTGDVVIVHEPLGQQGALPSLMRITADQVTATFEPPPRAATAPTTRSANLPGATAMQLKRLTAEGNVTVLREQSTLTADHIEYDPATHWLAGHGSDGRPAYYETPDPQQNLSAQDMSWNTQTWNVKVSGPHLVNPK